MNKKEIAHQYTSQMLGQEPTKLKEPDNQLQPQQPSELSQIQRLLPEIEMMYNRALENYRIKSEKQIENNTKEAQSGGEHSDRPIFSNTKYRGECGADLSIQQTARQQMGSRLYLAALLLWIFSALMTMLIIWTKMQ